MKSRSLLIFALVISLALLPGLQLALGAAQQSSSSSSSSTTTSSGPKAPYFEKLVVYTAGTNDYWLTSLSPVKITRPGIVAAESVSGVSAYELTAIEGSTALVGSQLFWPGGGYDVVKVPFIPYSGVFLNVTATSQGAAASAASDFGSTLGVSFQAIGSSGNNYTFYSSASFAIAGGTIFSSVPASNGGFARLNNASAWNTEPTPTAILTGVRSGSSFNHTVSYGSTEPGAIGTNGSLLLESALNLSHDTIAASPNATSTQVVVHTLDGLIKSKDNATVTNSLNNYTSTYSISLQPGARFRPNMTVVSNPPVLTATRSVTSGAVSSGGLLTMTLNFWNSANNATMSNVAVNDSWWTAYPSLFSLSEGNASFTIPSIPPNGNQSRAYVLKVLSSTTEDIVVPAASASYSYKVGNTTVVAKTMTNQLEVRTNAPGPAVSVQAASNILSGSSYGKPGKYVVTVTNTGNDPALNLKILNFTNPTLTPGSSWKVNMSLPLTSIANRNITRMFSVGWTAPDGTTGTLKSNPSTLVLSHASVLLPLVEFKLSANLTSQAVAAGRVNATFSMTNKGSVAVGNATVSQSLPTGITCYDVVVSNATGTSPGTGGCTSSGFSLTASSTAVLGMVTGTLRLNFTRDNYIIGAATVTTNQSGLVLKTLGSVLPIAGGVGVSKTFLPTAVFQGQDDNVTVRATNAGSLPIFNVSLSTSPDPFDSAVSGALNQQYPVLNSSVSQSLNYTVKMLTPGNHTSASTSISYVFGGVSTQYLVTSGNVLVYKPVVGSTSMKSTPTEGHVFSLAVSVQNLSPVNVTNVSFSISLPQGLSIVSTPAGVQVSGRTVTLSVPSLAAGATSNNSVILKGDFDGNFNPATTKLTFVYLGSTLTGVVTTPAIVVGVDALLRYELPIGAAVVLAFVAAIYMHRKLATPQVK
ncbi:MAG TPA: hypothetical protein VGS04_02430 [Nitrososphaerales archaeon]|nr:hypothetical protein [Nitrososphaerales archaeon]